MYSTNIHKQHPYSLIFKQVIPIVLDTITNDDKMSHTQLVHVLFIYKV
jgi:hypothetical protein